MMNSATHTMVSGITLVLGGARSGKSAFAESLVGSRHQAIYVATGQAFDDEMRQRIERHRRRRGHHWTTVEEPLDLGGALTQYAVPGKVVLVDCLTLWLSNLLHHDRDLDAESAILVESLAAARAPVLLVSNEVGLGIVPESPATRVFRDAAGRLHQHIATVAQRVYLVVAGLPMLIKDSAHEEK